MGSSLKSVTWLLPLATRGIAHSTRTGILTHSTRISHIWNSVRPTFHLLQIFHIRLPTPDGRGGRFNFPGQTCLDPLVALTGRTFAADNSDSLDSLARQTLTIRRIHFRPQSSAPLDFNRHECFFFHNSGIMESMILIHAK